MKKSSNFLLGLSLIISASSFGAGNYAPDPGGPDSRLVNTSAKDLHLDEAYAGEEYDFFISGIAVVPGSVGPGGLLTVSGNQCYNGNVLDADMGGCYVGFYISSNTTVDGGDYYYASSVSNLGSDDPCDFETKPLVMPSDLTAGTWYALLIADYDNAYAETNETNNVLAGQFTVKAEYDFYINSPWVSPGTAGPGDDITAGCSQCYAGNVLDADMGGCNVGYYLSADNSLDGSDLLLGSDASFLGQDDPCNSESATLTIPPGTSPGVYYILFIADYDDAYAEESESNNRGYATVTVSDPDPFFLDVSTSSVTVGYASGSSNTFTITSNTDWTASENADWLTVSPASGSASAILTVSATSANEGDVSRTAVILISGTGTGPVEFEVNQAPTPDLDADPDTLSLDHTAGSSQVVAITASSDWTVSTTASWLTVNPLAGSGNGAITVTTDSANTGTVARTTEITVSSTGPAPAIVHVIQEALAVLNLSDSIIELDQATGSSGTFEINSNINWSISSQGSWFSATPTTGSGTGTVTVTTTSANDGSEPRTAYLAVSGEGVAEVTVRITQMGVMPHLEVSSRNIGLEQALGPEGFFVITSNLQWNLEMDGTWLSASPTSGINSGTVTVKANSANESTETRTASILVTAEGSANLKITAQQDGAQASHTGPAGSLNRIRVYPNPTGGDLYIEFEKMDYSTILMITDVTGRMLHQGRIEKNTKLTRINIGHFKSGAYLLKLINEQGSTTRKVIVE